jgi:tetratricopeptide (TPR) repeat protein
VLPINRERQGQASRSHAIARKGLALLRAGNPKAALPLFHQALSIKESNGTAYIGLARAHEALGDQKTSLRYYRKVMYRDPSQGWFSSIASDYEHLIPFAIALQKAGEVKEAQSIYQKAVRVAPSRVASYLYVPDGVHTFDSTKMKASLHLALSDMAERRIHRSKKSDIDSALRERLVEAQAAVAVAPDYAPAHRMLGDALLYQSQYDSFYKRPEKAKVTKVQALQAYKRAASLGKGETRAAAQEAMRSSWFDDITKAAP